MKRIIYILTIILICGTITLPEISASERGRSEQSSRSGRGGRTGSSDRSSSGRQSSRSSSRENRGGSSSSNRTNRPSSGKDNGNYRPGNSGNHSGSYNPGSNRDNRPSSGKDNGNYRPGNSGNHSGSYNPGSNRDNRPSSGKDNGNYRPGKDNHGNHGNHGNYDNHGNHGNHYGHYNHGYRPRPEYNGRHYGHISRPPHRPYRPAPIVYHRPAPPVYYHPHCHITPLQAIIGVTLGIAFDASVNVFLGRNYYIDGYDRDYLYMRDLYAYNYSWPDVMMYYSNGYLTSSQFRYSTSYYDCSRYNSIYNQLYASYGEPAILRNVSGGRVVTWWGYDNNYITLEFKSEYTSGYGTRYYTNLIIGR